MIDLNADLGEGMSGDDDLLGIVTSVNVACGGHAGDRGTMQRTVARASSRRVAIGAHPSYPDREEFGRRRMTIPSAALRDSLSEQIAALAAIAGEEGTQVRYLKPHGALYHAVLDDDEHAGALVAAAAEHSLPLLLAPQAHQRTVGALAEARGVRIYGEGFADRGYDDEGFLLPRQRPGAVVSRPEDALAQALELARGRVRTHSGAQLPMTVRSICVHGDTPGAIELARSIRAGLARAKVDIRAWSEP